MKKTTAWAAINPKTRSIRTSQDALYIFPEYKQAALLRHIEDLIVPVTITYTVPRGRSEKKGKV